MAFTIIGETGGRFRATKRIRPACAMLVALREQEQGAESVRIIDSAGTLHDIRPV